MTGGSETTATTPRSICERYSDDTYARMRDDGERTAAYRAAIATAAPGRVCLDVGTGALALLAVMAAQAGAAHVYALEANPTAAEAARAHVAGLGLASRITVITGYSTDVELPERAHLLLHEILGEVAGAEGVARAITDAAKRHVAARGADAAGSEAPLSVPALARSLLAPAEFPAADYFASLPYPMLSAPGATSLKLPSLPRGTLLAAAQPFEELDFEALSPRADQDERLVFAIERAGVLRGLAVHIEVLMPHAAHVAAADTGIDISSARPGSHWPNVLLLLPNEVAVSVGDRLLVRTKARLASEEPTYRFEVHLLAQLQHDDEGHDAALPVRGDDGGADRSGETETGRLLGEISYP